MRRIKLSRTFIEGFDRLLEQGEDRFGTAVVAQKRALVREAIANHLAHFPKRPADPRIGLCTFAVTATPFLLIYDFDDAELRVHLIIHARSDRSRIDPKDVVW